MTPPPRIRGVLAPVVTPFGPDYAPDADRFVRHCRWLLDQGCAGLAVFGTNSEANSMSVEEKIELLDALVASGIPAAKLMPGTGHCALTDSLRLTRHAVRAGCAGVLTLPPFYYKDVTDEGLYRSFAAIIEGVADDRLQLYLYHIPPIAQVGISLALVERLLRAYPQAIAGIKDSSGDWTNTAALLDEFGGAGFDVFPGSEVFLLQALRRGGAGCITATGNVNPGAIARVYREWQSDGADALQEAITATRSVFQGYVMIPALKAAIAHHLGDPAWRTVRPPLVELDAAAESALLQQLADRGFAMHDLAPAGAAAPA
jgi:4-hydroxy-tetrahydrodipicolinate synthase